MSADRDSELSEAIKAKASYHPAPPELGARILAALPRAEPESAAPPAPAPSLRRRPWLNLGLAFACGVLASFALVRFQAAGDAADAMEQAVVASHVRSLMADHLADVASSDRHTVKPWFAGKLDFSPPVMDLGEEGFPLVGGRLDYLAQRPVAALVYAHQKHHINLFVWPSTDAPQALKALSQQGFNLVTWRDDGMELWAISDLSQPELRAFAETLRRKMRS